MGTEWIGPWLADPTTGVSSYDPESESPSGLVGSEACVHCHEGPRLHHAGAMPTSDLSGQGPAPEGFAVAAVVGSGIHRQAFLVKDATGWVRSQEERTPAGKVGSSSHFAVPGKVRGPGFELTEAQAYACLACHTTSGAPTDAARHVDDLKPGIGCEACHGPGRAHLDRLHQMGEDPRPPRAGGDDPTARIRTCGRCHGNPESVPVRPALSLARTVADRPAFGVLMSRCFTATKGPECSSCHPAHEPEKGARERTVGVCLGCHAIGGEKTKKTCLEAPEGPCADCHMPVQGGFEEAGNRAEYVDHWIRIRERDPTPATLTNTPEARWRTDRFANLLRHAVDTEKGTDRDRGLRWLRLATVRGMAGQGPLAEEAGKKAVELMPNEPFALYNLGNIYLSRGPNKQDQAIDVFRKALHLSPDHVMARIRLAEVFRRSGHFDEAETELREATKVRPDAGIAWRDLGEVLFSSGNSEGAVEALLKAVEMRPDDRKARSELVAALNKVERYSDELPHLRWLCKREGAHSQACGVLPVIERAAKDKAEKDGR